jgi:Plasmid encoded RepA protein
MKKKIPPIVPPSSLLPPDAEQDVGYMHSLFCQLSLPRRKPDTREFSRAFSGASMLLTAGSAWNGREWIEQGLPYGTKPRLMLADICTYAIRHRTREVPMESSVTGYLTQRLKLTSQGGETGPLTLFKHQAVALSVCSMKMGITRGKWAFTVNAPMFDKFECWADDRGRQTTMWPSAIALSERFYESLRSHAVPLPMETFRKLDHSALAMDIYTWLAMRLHSLKEPRDIPWAKLREQFSQPGAQAQAFQRNFTQALSQTLAVYPAARVRRLVGFGIRIEPSPPPVGPTKLFMGP